MTASSAEVSLGADSFLKIALRQAAKWSLLALVVLVVAMPIVVMFWRQLGLDFVDVFGRARTVRRIGDTLRNTGVLAVACLVLALIIGSLLARATSRMNGRFAAVATLLPLVPLTIPPVAAVIGWVFAFAPHVGYGNVALRAVIPTDAPSGPINISSMYGIVAVNLTYLVPFVYLFMLPAFRQVNPELEYAGRVCGASRRSTFFKIVLPVVRPSLMFAGAIVLLLGLSQFTAPLILGPPSRIDVITTEMFRQTNEVPTDFPVATLLAGPVVLISLLLVWLQRRSVLRDPAAFTASNKSIARDSSRSNWGILVHLIYAGFAVIPPLGGLLLVSLSPFWSGKLDFGALSLNNYRAGLTTQRFIDAVSNTLLFAVGAVILVTLLAVFLGLVLRRPSHETSLIDYVVNLPLAVPGIIFGMAFFVTFALPPIDLYGSGWLFVLAYVTVTLPFATRIVMAGLVQVGISLESAARVCGASQFRALGAITLPLIRQNVVSGALLAFVLITHEFGAPALLRTGATDVLATLIYDRWQFGVYPQVAVLGIFMVVLSMVSVALILALGKRKSGVEA